MKLSIWQQFSSNHSNNFTVIGTFKTETDAHFAYLKIRRVLRQIIEAHQKNPPEYNPTPGDDVYQSNFPSQAEIDILAPYGVVPKRLTDWTTYPRDMDETVNGAIRLLDKSVIFCDPITGNSGADTFVQLMSNFSDEVIYSEEIELTDILVTDIQCIVPDEQVAKFIYEGLIAQKQDLSNRSSWGKQKPIAWLTYYDGKYNPEYEKLVEIEQRCLEWERWRKKYFEFDKLSRRERKKFHREIALHAENEPPELTSEDGRVDQMLLRLVFRDYMGEIQLNKTMIDCRNLHFEYFASSRAIPAIISWMRSLDCTVDYQFRLTQFRAEATVNCLAVDEITAKQIVEKLKTHQISQNHIPDDSSDYLFTARDTISSSFDEITIQIYDLKDRYQLEKSLKVQGCRRIRIAMKMVEIAEGSDI